MHFIECLEFPTVYERSTVWYLDEGRCPDWVLSTIEKVCLEVVFCQGFKNKETNVLSS